MVLADVYMGETSRALRMSVSAGVELDPVESDYVVVPRKGRARPQGNSMATGFRATAAG
jgi:hypothetical protein